MSNNTATFTVTEIGEISGEKWHGSFTTKLRLSHSEQFRRDEIRRRILGPDSEHASARAANAAAVFSEIIINLTDAPSWWKNSNDGMDLEDDNIVSAIYDAIVLEKKKAVEAMKKKGEEAATELKKDVVAK